MPAGLPREIAAEWRGIVRLVKDFGILDRCDAAILESYCRHVVRWRSLCVEIDRSKYKGGLSYRRKIMAADAAHKQLLKAISELGLSPNARARIRIEAPKEGKNELAEFLSIKAAS